MPKRSFLFVTLLAGLVVGVVGTVAAYSLQRPTLGTTAASTLIDRATLEQILAEREITPTGQTRRFDLVVQETPGVEPGGLIVAINVRAGGGPAPTVEPSGPAPSDGPVPTMDPDMPGMPGMSPVPSMTP